MMFVDICICYKYYFQDCDLKINLLTLKVTLNHRPSKDLESKSKNDLRVKMKMRYYMFLALFGKIIFLIILTFTLDFAP